MYRFLPIIILTSCLMSTGVLQAQKTGRLQTKPALIRLIDGNLRQAGNQYKVLMSRIPPDRLPKTYYANADKEETSDGGAADSILAHYCTCMNFPGIHPCCGRPCKD
jgi:unsaturated chondroitin disaccharide hydrolase